MPVLRQALFGTQRTPKWKHHMRLPEVHTLAGKLVETHEAGEFSFDRNCCLQRAFRAEREGMPRNRRGLGEPWRKCHPHRLQSCTSQRFGISIRAFYNGCFVPRVFLTHRHSSEHKTVWIDSTTFYWATVLRAFTRIISFGQFSVRPSRFLQKPGRQME